MLSAVAIAIYVAQYSALSAAFSMGCKISGDSARVCIWGNGYGLNDERESGTRHEI